ncbi:hypothetical protein MY4038_006192 [Beauveria bassiana]
MRFVVNNRFNLEFEIAQGGFCSVYLGTDLENGGREVALKLCHFKHKDEIKFPIDEASVLADINGNKGIPTISWSGHECEYYIIAQELLGPTLYALLEQCRVFSFKTTLLIADQAIERLEFVHSKGYLHGDIKPANMAMGQGEHGNLLYFLDFGLARKFGHNEEWKSRHGGKLFYPYLYANYGHLRELFRCAFRNHGYQDDNIYDWTSMWFNEVHGIKSTPKEQSELVEKQITTSLTPHALASAGGSIEMQL